MSGVGSHDVLRKGMVLFLGTGPDGLHLMAEGFARSLASATVEPVSASMMAGEPHPLAVEVMREVGIDISRLDERSPLDVEVFTFDLVVTLGDFDAACMPNLPGMPPHFHWDVEVPDLDRPAAEIVSDVRRARDLLGRKVGAVFESNMIESLQIARRNLELVLDNMAHAVMAHTKNRRIFYFNREAEKITGFGRSELLGQDCHEVFTPERFCGGDCMFCTRPFGDDRVVRQRTNQVSFTRKDGQQRCLEMTITPLSDAQEAYVGALVSFKDVTELDALKRRVRHRHSLHGLVGRDPKTLSLFEQIREVASVNVPVLIEGESGTGKELVACAIHEESDRAKGPFVPVNCGALPEGILESELFGHVKGAFTGAVQDKKGRFELADGGTLFLDEVAELSPSMQVKLLRVLQERSFERVGGERSIHVDVRILSATNQDLRKLMEARRFRRDLYYRLCVVPIRPVPLRERVLDIPALVDHFLEDVALETGRPILIPSNEALDALMRYSWPGNVRELRNVIEYVNVKCQSGLFGVEHLPPEVVHSRGSDTEALQRTRFGPEPKLDHDEVMSALARARGNKSRAAKLLGVGRTTLYRFLSSRT
jgi:PAS domain S-box-containing protein